VSIGLRFDLWRGAPIVRAASRSVDHSARAVAPIAEHRAPSIDCRALSARAKLAHASTLPDSPTMLCHRFGLSRSPAPSIALLFHVCGRAALLAQCRPPLLCPRGKRGSFEGFLTSFPRCDKYGICEKSATEADFSRFLLFFQSHYTIFVT